MVVAFRRHLLLPRDDCLDALQPSIPQLRRSASHRCLLRNGISRLSGIEGDKPKRQRFKRCPIGFFHTYIAEAQTTKNKLHLFVGIDRTSKFAVTQLVDKADRRTAWEFLENLLKAVLYRIHAILTDNGIQFAEQPRNRNTAWSRQMRFDMIHEANEIEHRLTKPNLIERCRDAYPMLGRFFADAGYAGQKLADAIAHVDRLVIEIVRRFDAHRFVVLPRR